MAALAATAQRREDVHSPKGEHDERPCTDEHMKGKSKPKGLYGLIFDR